MHKTPRALAMTVLALAVLGCTSQNDDEAPSANSSTVSTSSPEASTTTTTAEPTSTLLVAVDSPVGHYVTTITADDGRPDLQGTWGVNIEADGTWSICPFCTTVPGPFGAGYALEGERIVLQPDSTCSEPVAYEWHVSGARLTLVPVDEDPCGLVPGNRQLILTEHPLLRVG